MLKAFLESKKSMYWILMHIALGLACTFVREVFILWLLVFVFSSYQFVTSGSRNIKIINLLYFITYVASTSLLARMTKAYMYKLPWEFGKYVIFFGSIYAILVLNSRKGLKGFLLFFLLIPAMFFGGERDIRWHDIIFNLLGPISISFAVIAFSQLKVTKEQFRLLMRLVLMPSISVLAYVVVKTPDFDNINFDLAANFSTTGGYGSNQVSTVLGIGLFITFVFWVNKWRLTGNRNYDLALMLGFAFQGLLSFSRGGMIGGILGILIFLFMLSLSNSKMKRRFNLPKIGKFLIPLVVGLILTWQIADTITGGLLSLRYTGETNATLRGSREVDLNTITTGRFDIFLMDVEIWQDYFVMGVGAGVSQHIRSDMAGTEKPIASHVELSRLVADHGLLGFTWFVLLTYIGLKLIIKRNNAKYQGVLVALFAIAVYTTFHAATRTYLTPLLIGISLVSIIDIKDFDEKYSK